METKKIVVREGFLLWTEPLELDSTVVGMNMRLDLKNPTLGHKVLMLFQQ